MLTDTCQVCQSQLPTNPIIPRHGVTSCEICLKFVSGFIRKIKSSETPTPVQCKTNNGNCAIQPVIRKNRKHSRKSLEGNCTACWLKRCLASYRISNGNRDRLNKLLPESMRNIELKMPSPFSIKSEMLSDLHGSASKSSIFTSLLTRPTFGSRLPQWPSTSTMSHSDHNETEIKSIKLLPPTNPLAENNVKFGSSPSIRPTVLEKPLIMVPQSVVEVNREKASPTFKLDNVPLESATSSKETTTTSSSKEKEGKSSKDAKATKEVKAAKEAKPVKEPKVPTSPMPDVTSSSNEATSKKSTSHEPAPEETSRLRLRKKERAEPQSTAAPVTVPPVAETAKRQRIDLKGPRVKHVCRSASIVLGQPLATFDDEPLPEMVTPPRSDTPSMELQQTTAEAAPPKRVAAVKQIETSKQVDVECADSTRLSPPATPITNDSENEIVASNAKDDIAEDEVSSSSTINEMKITEFEPSKPITRKVTRPANVNAHAVPKIVEKPVVKAPPTINIDFWQNLDPDEISQNGYGIIVSEECQINGLCYLCGSVGLDPLISCACCCETYHQFCVEESFNMKPMSLDDTNLSLLDTSIDGGYANQQKNWMCPQCTVCESCRTGWGGGGSRVKCQKCQKNFHSTCLGTSKRPLGTDRPLICVNCLKCKRCSSPKVYKFVGNMPMCSSCFRRRQDKNFCPLCQKFYDESDYNLKMMECGDCRHWVHAKCEQLNDEQYNMLSVLPEHIEFICRKCNPANATSSHWRDAVTAEFQAGLASIMKCLSKSRSACALLRHSPRKKSIQCTCIIDKNCTAIRAIPFDDENDDALRSDEDSRGPNAFDKDDSNQSSASTDAVRRPTQCFCGAAQKQSLNTSQSFFDIKQKVTDNKYFSLADFNYDMNLVINTSECEELFTTYKEILCETFPWFQNETKACTDALEDVYDPCFGADQSDDIECDQEVPMPNMPDDMDTIFFQPTSDKDTRCCALCKGIGDGRSNEESRMLYGGQNIWVHANCAMWSAEVFEEIDGSLQKVQSAVSRGKHIKCAECGQKGATVGCNARNCSEQYHFPCARRANCAFMVDKKVFCPKHRADTHYTPEKEENSFEVMRTVYVEFDRRKRKGVEPSKVQFIKGSLHVRQLGRFVPKLSDLSDAIVPAGYSCVRRYWSTKDPCRMTLYTFRTFVQNDFSSAVDFGRNFTVDHSSALAHLGMAQIAKWHSNLMHCDENDQVMRQERSMRELMNAVTGHNEATNEDEPQNNTDLFPQDMTDDILADVNVSHDILDGMLDDIDIDIGEMGNWDLMDSKNGIDLNGDLLKVDDLSQNSQEFGENRCMYSEMHVADAMLSSVTRSTPTPQQYGRMLKRSKSEVGPRSNSGNRQQHQRSSLNMKAKNEQCSGSASSSTSSVAAAAAAAAAKRRKVSMLDLPETVLQSLRNRKDDVPVEPTRIPTPADEIKNKQFTWSAVRALGNRDNTSNDENEMKGLPSLSQMDGTEDISCSSEGPAEYTIFTNGQIETAIKCERCHCAYRSQDTFNRHLATCDGLASGDGDTEIVTRTSDLQSSQQVQNNMVITSINGTEYCMLQQNGQQQQPVYSLNGTTLTQMPQAMPMQTVQNNGLTMPMQGMIINPTTGAIQQQPAAQQQIFAQPLTIGNLNQQFLPLSMSTSAPSGTQPQISQYATPQFQIATAESATIKAIQSSAAAQKGKKAKKVVLPAGRPTKPIQIKKAPNARIEPAKPTATVQVLNQNMPIIRTLNGLDGNMLIQSAPQNQAQPMIMQQLAPNTQNNIMQYVQTSDGQYFAMPTATTEYKPQTTQFLGGNSLMPGTFQLQSDASGNLVLANAPTGLQVIQNGNGLQLAQAPQPQVIGTLLQQPTAAIQCGMMANEQMVLGTTPTFEMVANPANGCMLLGNQPMYYGLETIVQNTVMQSQQFVSTAMQGVLSQNSSFSATTTQVFQASKIEPIMEMPGGYVILNQDGTLMQPTQQQLLAANIIQPTAVSAIQAQPTQIQPAQIQATATTSGTNWRFVDDKSVTTQSIQQPIIQQQMQVQPQIVQAPKPIIKSSPIVVSKIQPQPKLITSNANPTTIIVNQPKTSPIILPKPSPTVSSTTTTTIDVSQLTAQQQLNGTIVSEAHHITTNGSCTITATQSSNLIQKKPNILKPIGSGMKITSATIKPKIISKPVSVTPKITKPATIVGKDVLPLSNNPQIITVTTTDIPTSRANVQNSITVFSQPMPAVNNGFKSPSITIQQVTDHQSPPRMAKDTTIIEANTKTVSPSQYLPKISEQISNQISITPIPLTSSMSIIPTTSYSQTQQQSQASMQTSSPTITASLGHPVTSSIQLPHAPSFSSGE